MIHPRLQTSHAQLVPCFLLLSIWRPPKAPPPLPPGEPRTPYYGRRGSLTGLRRTANCDNTLSHFRPGHLDKPHKSFSRDVIWPEPRVPGPPRNALLPAPGCLRPALDLAELRNLQIPLRCTGAAHSSTSRANREENIILK